MLSWGNNEYNQTNLPSGVTNLASIAAGAYHNLGWYGVPPLRMTDPRLDAAGFSTAVQTRLGQIYLLQFREEVEDGAWTEAARIAGDGTILRLSHSTPGIGHQFYRVMQSP